MFFSLKKVECFTFGVQLVSPAFVNLSNALNVHADAIARDDCDGDPYIICMLFEDISVL